LRSAQLNSRSEFPGRYLTIEQQRAAVRADKTLTAEQRAAALASDALVPQLTPTGFTRRRGRTA
jgi:hypothetical protein